jgi:hypothetical protein
MAEKSRIRLNLITKEIEIEGDGTFVRTYFDKIQNIISEHPDDQANTVKARRGKRVKKKHVTVNVPVNDKVGKETRSLRPIIKSESGNVEKTGTAEKKITNISAVVTLIQESKEGLSTGVLKEKTGFSEQQIWNIVARAAKDGRIKKGKRGLYVGV